MPPLAQGGVQPRPSSPAPLAPPRRHCCRGHSLPPQCRRHPPPPLAAPAPSPAPSSSAPAPPSPPLCAASAAPPSSSPSPCAPSPASPSRASPPAPGGRTARYPGPCAACWRPTPLSQTQSPTTRWPSSDAARSGCTRSCALGQRAGAAVGPAWQWRGQSHHQRRGRAWALRLPWILGASCPSRCPRTRWGWWRGPLPAGKPSERLELRLGGRVAAWSLQRRRPAGMPGTALSGEEEAAAAVDAGRGGACPQLRPRAPPPRPRAAAGPGRQPPSPQFATASHAAACGRILGAGTAWPARIGPDGWREPRTAPAAQGRAQRTASASNCPISSISLPKPLRRRASGSMGTWSRRRMGKESISIPGGTSADDCSAMASLRAC